MINKYLYRQHFRCRLQQRIGLRLAAAQALLALLAVPAVAQNAAPRPEDSEVWDPEPAVVTPGIGAAPPSDAIVLLGRQEPSGWRHTDGRELEWHFSDGVLTVVGGTGDIETVRSFGDVQLHVEWRTPVVVDGDGQDRGNSGVFLQKRYEVQVLDSFDNRTYSNGQAASVYKQHIPLVNASRVPGEWQTYDIAFKAPTFDSAGALTSPAYVTVLHNGVLVQHDAEIQGETVFMGEPSYTAHPKALPLMLQDHSNPVSFRNIWVRELSVD